MATIKKANTGKLIKGAINAVTSSKKVTIPSGLKKSIKKSQSGPIKITPYSSEAERIASGKKPFLQQTKEATSSLDGTPGVGKNKSYSKKGLEMALERRLNPEAAKKKMTPAQRRSFEVDDSYRKNGGNVPKAKSGGSFPDLNKDGKVTRADILKGRGVIAKKGATIKKAKSGTKVKKAFLGSALGGVGKSLLGGGGGGLGNIGDIFGGGLGKGLNKIMGSLGKKGIGKGKNPLADPMVSKSMKSGGSMKKCKYGCK
jgi:hypothetical protein